MAAALPPTHPDRRLALAKKLVADSGYKGERILLMAPSDQPAIGQLSQVTGELF